MPRTSNMVVLSGEWMTQRGAEAEETDVAVMSAG